MSSLDLFFLQKELKQLCGGKIEKIYQKGKALQIDIFLPGKGAFGLYFEPGKIFITEYKRSWPLSPEHFCLFLRKHLEGQKIADIRQYDFERIVELETDRNILIFEVFSKGNIILCDKAYTVLMPLEVQIWKDRQIITKKPYRYPPLATDPFKIDMYNLKKSFMSSEKTIVTFIASDLSLSGIYAEEVCARANIDKTKLAKSIDNDEALRIYEAIHSLIKEFDSQIILENGKKLDFAPFSMKIYEKNEVKKIQTLTHALDEFFTEREAVKIEERKEEKFEGKIQKIKRIADEQTEAIKKLKRIESESRKIAEAINSNTELIQNIISVLEKARKQKLSWEEIKQRVAEEDTPETRAIKEIKEDEAKITVKIGAAIFDIDFRKSARENAEIYFDEAKRAKLKTESTKKARTGTLREIKKLKTGKEKIILEERETKPRKRRRGKWFEKFHWFITTDGFLVIGGRDATQNEMIFKKYLEKEDIVLHADVSGAPLTVVKAEGKQISPLAIREAAEFAAAYSSAWKAGLGEVDVYWIRPEQVSKSPPPGQFLVKGAFMIYGQKNYLKKMELKVAIGVKFETSNEGILEARPICGNVQSVNEHAKYFVTIIPGDVSQQELAKQIKITILQKALPEDKPLIEQIILEDIQKLIPAGSGSIIG